MQNPILIPRTFIRNIARMQIKGIGQLLVIFLLGIVLSTCSRSQTADDMKPNTSSWSLNDWLPFSKPKTVWQSMASNFNLIERHNPAVNKKILAFSKQKSYLHKLTNNAEPYLYYIYQQTKRRNMPAEIALLPMVESNYTPFAYSKRGATGLWQMMPGTASGFGLDIDWWMDGRRDVITSTKAALDYLDYLHKQFGDWLLAIAAYDSGEGTVQNAIAHNKQLHKPTDFWSLPLPQETKQYIPKLLALAAIISNPKYYHVKLNPVPNRPAFEVVDMNRQIALSQIAKMAETTLTKIRQLNPGFRRWATIPKGSYKLLLPKNKAAIFKLHLLAPNMHRIRWAHHKVKKGESLGLIAYQFHTKVNLIKEINDLKSNKLQIGKDLLIPQSTYHAQAKQQRRVPANIAEDNIPGPKRLTHTVQANESLWNIAKRYHVTPAKIRYWNNMTYHSKLHSKQKLVIWKRHVTRYYHYTIKLGDSLSKIAHHFGVNVKKIKQTNRLSNSIIRAGRKLVIPITT